MRATAAVGSPLLVVIALFCLVLFGSAQAAVPATYSGEAAVGSQSEAERGEALKTALAEVVIRLSGDPGVLSRADVARAVADASKYVLQYQYRRNSAIESGQASSLSLVAEFDSVAVDRLLSQLGLTGAGSTTAIDTTPSEGRIWISGIESPADYARVVGYLSRQSMLRNAQPVEARGDGLLVKLSIAGSLSTWLQTVEGEGTLRVNNTSPPIDGLDATLALSR